MGWLAPTVLVPYVLVVVFSTLGIIVMCICFCLDVKNGNSQESSWKRVEDANDTVDGATKKMKEDKTQEVDIEMDTFNVSNTNIREAGQSRETSFGVEEADSKKTPRVLRGLSSPQEGRREGGQGRVSLKEKVLSGSRGGQSSWAYVNLAFEKDVDLILSPETLKRRKEERTARGERLDVETRGRKDESGGKKSKEQGRTEPVGKTVDPGARGEDRGKAEMKTFGRGWENWGGERRSDRTGDKSSTMKIKKTRATSNSWPLSKGEGGEERETTGWERNQIVRGYENLAMDVTEGTEGFRLKQLTKKWDTDTWGKGGKGDGGIGGGEGTIGGRDAVGEKQSPGDNDDVTISPGRPLSPSSPESPLSSQFSTSTKLLLSPEDEEAEGEEEGQGRDGSSSARVSYSTTLSRGSGRGGLREGEISFFAHGRKRDFKYFSAQ